MYHRSKHTRNDASSDLEAVATVGIIRSVVTYISEHTNPVEPTLCRYIRTITREKRIRDSSSSRRSCIAVVFLAAAS